MDKRVFKINTIFGGEGREFLSTIRINQESMKKLLINYEAWQATEPSGSEAHASWGKGQGGRLGGGSDSETGCVPLPWQVRVHEFPGG